MTSRVLLTGCCGYIGSRIALDLLAAGFSVRGTSREPEYARKLFAEAFELHGLDEAARSRLEIVQGELLDARSFHGAADGCSIVVHTACPVVTTVGVPRSEMIDPALIGTENVVREAARAGSVTRFIHMSSVVTLLDHHRPARSGERRTLLGPSDWNETASPDTDPYAFAKVRGERRARELVAELIPGALFASVLPGPVVGPPIAGTRVPASIDKTLSPLLDGRLKTGSVDLWLALVDVRDVSAAFVELARLNVDRFAAVAERRFICVTSPVPRMQELADAIRSSFPRYAKLLPKRSLPLPRVVLLGVMRLLLRREEYSYTSAMLGRPLAYDTSLAERTLGIRFRGAGESLTDTVAWLHDRGLR